jgi:hypothetical protein
MGRFGDSLPGLIHPDPQPCPASRIPCDAVEATASELIGVCRGSLPESVAGPAQASHGRSASGLGRTGGRPGGDANRASSTARDVSDPAFTRWALHRPDGWVCSGRRPATSHRRAARGRTGPSPRTGRRRQRSPGVASRPDRGIAARRGRARRSGSVPGRARPRSGITGRRLLVPAADGEWRAVAHSPARPRRRAHPRRRRRRRAGCR